LFRNQIIAHAGIDQLQIILQNILVLSQQFLHSINQVLLGQMFQDSSVSFGGDNLPLDLFSVKFLKTVHKVVKRILLGMDQYILVVSQGGESVVRGNIFLNKH
jgi:hypothetical protein